VTSQSFATDDRYDLTPLAGWRTTYASSGRELTGFLLKPDGGGARPGLILNHGSDGLSRNYLSVAQTLNAMGYAAFLPVRRGYNGNPGPNWQASGTEPMWQETGARQITDALRQESDDVLASRDWLAAQPDVDAERIGVMGLSFGGIVTILACAKSDGFRAAISFAASGMAWQSNPPLQAALIEAIYAITTPIFLIQAQTISVWRRSTQWAVNSGGWANLMRRVSTRPLERRTGRATQ
jgi:carboxymethylenebutenolidase